MKHLSGNNYLVIGVMSGTSLDGLDIAAVEFSKDDNDWNFALKAAETVEYSDNWQGKLRNAPSLSGEQLMELHTAYGRLIGSEIKVFMEHHHLRPDLISSHGHTIFHQPEKGFTFQAGDGHSIAVATQTATIADFRSGDVALGGQGAPLVPAGDRLLFPAFDYCLNLGGFANISFEKNNRQIAFDICPANFILNELAAEKGKTFDKNGELGKKGKVNSKLLEQLNNLPFYKQQTPKSLGREWMEHHFLPRIHSFNCSTEDKLRTIYEHIAVQISQSLPGKGKMLVTGGGAFNSFLMERISHHSNSEIIVPSPEIISFKEAIVFAFLGLLRNLGEINCYASVTGAQKDSSAGILFHP